MRAFFFGDPTLGVKQQRRLRNSVSQGSLAVTLTAGGLGAAAGGGNRMINRGQPKQQKSGQGASGKGGRRRRGLRDLQSWANKNTQQAHYDDHDELNFHFDEEFGGGGGGGGGAGRGGAGHTSAAFM